MRSSTCTLFRFASPSSASTTRRFNELWIVHECQALAAACSYAHGARRRSRGLARRRSSCLVVAPGASRRCTCCGGRPCRPRLAFEPLRSEIGAVGDFFPDAFGLIGLHARSTDLCRFNKAGDGERVVAHDFGIEAISADRARVIRFFGSRFFKGFIGRICDCLTIRGARHDEAMHVLQVPAALARTPSRANRAGADGWAMHPCDPKSSADSTMPCPK